MSADRDRNVRRQKQTRVKARKRLAREAKPSNSAVAKPAMPKA